MPATERVQCLQRCITHTTLFEGQYVHAVSFPPSRKFYLEVSVCKYRCTIFIEMLCGFYLVVRRSRVTRPLLTPLNVLAAAATL